MPAAKRVTVITNDRLAGNLLQPKKSATNIFEPIKIKIKDKAYFRYINLGNTAANAKYKARKPNIANMLLV